MATPDLDLRNCSLAQVREHLTTVAGDMTKHDIKAVLLNLITRVRRIEKSAIKWDQTSSAEQIAGSAIAGE